MIIRNMRADDVEAVASIEAEVFSDPWSKESFQKEVCVTNHIYLVAEENHNIIGYCGLWEVSGEGYITNVCVVPDSRGRAVGTKMLTELIRIAEQDDITAVTLEVRVSNEAAQHLYKKLGFKEAGIRKDFYSHPREDAVIMWKYKQ